MAETPRPFTQDAALTAIAVNFQNPDVALVADQVLPRHDVGDENYKYDYYPPEEVFTVPDTTVGRRGAVPQVEFSAEQRTGTVVDRGLESPVPNSDIDRARRQRANNNSSYDPEARAVEGLKHLVDLDREVRVASLVTNLATYDADKRVTLAGADKWSDPNSDPIGDVLAGQDATFIARPNYGVMGRDVYTVLRTHPKILKAVHGNDGDSGVATKEQIARIFELNELLIGDSFVNTARKGQAANYARTWQNSFALFHRSSAATHDNGIPTFGITAEMRENGSTMIAGRIPSAYGGLRGSTIIRVGESIEEHIIAPSVAYLIDAPI